MSAVPAGIQFMKRALAPVVFVGAVELRMFASSQREGQQLSFGTGLLPPGAELSYHKHPVSEAVTVLEGEASISVEGRLYGVTPFDCVHVPAGTPHLTANASDVKPLVLLWAFAAATPSRELVAGNFEVIDRGDGQSCPGDPEHVQRYALSQTDERMAASFRDLFGTQMGCASMCGRMSVFKHNEWTGYQVCDIDTAITIIGGAAECEISRQNYRLEEGDTLLIPAKETHRCRNSGSSAMTMIWLYGQGDPSVSIIEGARRTAPASAPDKHRA